MRANPVKLLNLHRSALIAQAVLDLEQTRWSDAPAPDTLPGTTMGNGEYPLGDGHVPHPQEI